MFPESQASSRAQGILSRRLEASLSYTKGMYMAGFAKDSCLDVIVDCTHFHSLVSCYCGIV